MLLDHVERETESRVVANLCVSRGAVKARNSPRERTIGSECEQVGCQGDRFSATVKLGIHEFPSGEPNAVSLDPTCCRGYRSRLELARCPHAYARLRCES